MKSCEQCGTQFSFKRDSAKYCSTKCRVKWNRAHPKIAVSKIQMEVLYTQMLDLVSEMKERLEQQTKMSSQEIPEIKRVPNYFAPNIPKKEFKLVRTVENYLQLKEECECVEDWKNLKEEIMSSNLSPKQKSLLTN